MHPKESFEIDWGLFGVYFALVFFGLINLLSATAAGKAEGGLFWVLNNPSPHVKSQFYYVALGLVLMFLVTRIDYRIFERMAYPLYVIGMLTLLFVLLVGQEISGSQSWIILGPIRLQPSEPCKLILVIALAKFYHADRRRLIYYDLKDLFVPLLLTGVPLTLLALEHDLGTTLLYIFFVGSIFFFAGIRPRSVGILASVGIVSSVLAYKFLLRQTQRARILTFLNPEFDPLGRGYHAIQSLIAVGSGRFLGKGYLAGSQSQLKFLPEQHTDFIFSVLAEEWGFVGGFLLIVLYLSLIILCINIAARAKEKFGTFLAFGIAALFFWQIVVNLGAVLGLMPITGITLPFLSYGGSSMITLSLAVGFLQSISMRRHMF